MRRKLKYHKFPLLFIFFTFGSFFVYIFSRIISLRADGLYFGHENVWSDWALHVTLANIFAYKDPSVWFSYHPLYAQGKFTYPFLMDFISGILMRMGLSLSLSFILPSILFSLTLLASIYFLFYLLFKSRVIPIVAIALFVFSSGLGFVIFLGDFMLKPSVNLILNPIREYSRLDIYGWATGNVLVGLLIPQRAFLLGLTLGILSLLGLTFVILRPHVSKRSKVVILLLSGISAGVLPITHPHSFIAIVLITSVICLANFGKLKLLSCFFVPATLISLCLYLIFINGGIENRNFFTFLPGWGVKNPLEFITMWLNIWGIMIPLALVSFVILIKERKKQPVYVLSGFFLVFILSNLFLFQPTHWDNTKLFWWAYLGFCGLSSFILLKLWRTKLSGKILVIFLFISLTFTGVIEIVRLSHVDQHSFRESSSEEINLGLQIREATRPTDRFLTAPTHNHFIMIWALRPILMGYTGWVFNYGFNYQQTERDVRKMFLGGDDTQFLLNKYKISYVVVGPTERDSLKANEEYFKKNFHLVFSSTNYRVYATHR